MPDELDVTCSTSGTGSGHLKLQWSDNSAYEKGYVVERKEERGAWRQIANLITTGTNTTGVKSYEDTGATCTGSSVYYYRVAAYKAYNMPDETISTYSVAVKYPLDRSGGNAARTVVSRSDQVIGLQADSVATRTETSLHGAYPNPFNPVTTVRFSLAEAGPVRLRVYDVLGRRVAVLANSDMAAGAHSVKFEAAHLPSGVYLLRMETARQHWTHWVSLVK